MESQLMILTQNLEQKLEALRKIQEYNRRQAEIFTAGKVDINHFDAAMEEKQRLIDELIHLDEDFELLYEKLAGELKDNRQQYASQIRTLQAKVAEVMELSASVRIQEEQNRKRFGDYFGKERTALGQRRKNARNAFDYYKSMSGAGYIPPQMYDNKQ